MTEKLKVIATGPIIRNHDGVLLKVSAPAFKANPGQVYTLPRTPFWLQLVKTGALKEVGPVPQPEQLQKVRKQRAV